jgi:formylglycine-generating enzyme required for sulfatase activity
LLRALYGASDEVAAVRHGRALGFEFRTPIVAAPSVVLGPVTGHAVGHVGSGPAESATVPPLQTSFFALTGYRKLPEPTPEEAEAEKAAKAAAEAVEPLSDKDCEPTGLPLPFQPLVRRERLWPRLRQSLQQRWAAGLDLPRLVSHLSRGELPRSLPARRHSGLTAQVFVLWDAADRLTPYAEDYRRLIAELHHLHGAAGLRLWRVHDGPDEVWGEWAPERVAWPERWPGRSWRKESPGPCGIDAGLPDFPAGSRVLLLSDLGGLARHAAPARRWLRALRRWRTEGVSSTAWVPQGPRWVLPALAAAADEVHCLTPAPQRVRSTGQAGEDSLTTHLDRNRPSQEDLCDELLVRASICIHLEPELLRSLRQTQPALAAEPGLEALAWSDQPKVRSSRVSRALAAEVAPAYRQRFGQLPLEQKRAALKQVMAAHRAIGRSTSVAEALLWQVHAGDEAASLESETVRGAQEWAQAWALRLDQTVATSGSPGQAASSYAKDLLGRIGSDAGWMAAQSAWASRLVLTAGQRAVPAGVSAQALAAASRAMTPRQSTALQLWPHERNHELVLAASGATVPKYVLHPELHVEARHCLVTKADGSREFLSRPTWEVALARRGQPGQQIRLRSDRAEFSFTELSRPDWAVEWGRDDFGLFATLEVAGTPQRLRHLPPGRFLMGSPATEPGRDSDEGPQHEVTLTRGFWLADTCCTQALWLAVMGGKNPSYFWGDASLPVDRVSWDDVQTFLGRLQRLLPKGVEGVLPTDAQWEYACRAGTQTPFSCGDALTPEQANFGEILGKTVPVKSLPANPWGLYEMHGNLWEWCADDRRDYGAEPVEDPDGGRDGGDRVLRGGSWCDGRGGARSAYRARSLHVSRYGVVGFRFALRSIEPSAGGGISGGTEPARVLPQVEPL